MDNRNDNLGSHLQQDKPTHESPEAKHYRRMVTRVDQLESALKHAQCQREHLSDEINNQLTHIDKQLYTLLGCYQFYHHSIAAITEDLDDYPTGYNGLRLNQQWLTQSGTDLLKQVCQTRDWVRKQTSETIEGGHHHG